MTTLIIILLAIAAIVLGVLLSNKNAKFALKTIELDATVSKLNVAETKIKSLTDEFNAETRKLNTLKNDFKILGAANEYLDEENTKSMRVNEDLNKKIAHLEQEKRLALQKVEELETELKPYILCENEMPVEETMPINDAQPEEKTEDVVSEETPPPPQQVSKNEKHLFKKKKKR